MDEPSGSKKRRTAAEWDYAPRQEVFADLSSGSTASESLAMCFAWAVRADALIVLQVGLAALNIRGALKTGHS